MTVDLFCCQGLQFKKPVSLQAIACLIDADIIHGKIDTQKTFTGFASLEQARPGCVVFLHDMINFKHASSLKGCLLISKKALVKKWSAKKTFEDCVIIAAYCSKKAYIQMVEAYMTTNQLEQGKGFIDPSACIDETADVHATAKIGKGVILSKGVVIGKNVCIDPYAVLGPNCIIGHDTRLYSHAVLGPNVILGNHCRIKSHASIGQEGFGYLPDQDKWSFMPHLGQVIIGDRVHIGAHVAIDRAVLTSTQIGDDVIMDNHVHIAHNVNIGQSTAMAAFVVIAGSCTIGSGCQIGGHTGISDHITIPDNTVLLGGSTVTASIDKPAVYGSYMMVQPIARWRKNLHRLMNLDKTIRILNKKEKPDAIHEY
jgi:UDP-3-O-[3-hydroxymyristoyl] glucosamine N-acyltransferase